MNRPQTESSFPFNPYRELHPLELVGSEPEQEFDELAEVAAGVCGTPMSLITLLGEKWQYHKARVGVQVPKIPRNVSFCQHTVQRDETFVVKNASTDRRFATNPLVTGEPWIRFYAGVPLYSPSGFKVGALCVIDTVERQLRDWQLRDLSSLAHQVNARFELRATRNRADMLVRRTMASGPLFELLNDIPSTCSGSFSLGA